VTPNYAAAWTAASAFHFLAVLSSLRWSTNAERERQSIDRLWPVADCPLWLAPPQSPRSASDRFRETSNGG